MKEEKTNPRRDFLELIQDCAYAGGWVGISWVVINNLA